MNEIDAEIESRPSAVDTALLLIFLLGIYTSIAIRITSGVPLPAVLSGIAGGLLLLKHYDHIRERHLAALFAVMALYLASILSAHNYDFLGERFKGFIQISYSLVIGYGFYITAIQYDRERLARLFLLFCIAIVIGCALETYGGLQPISDAVRERIYDFGIYRSNLRDQLLYGRVRPKLFTSEPSAVSFAFTLFAFAWYVLSTWRTKLLAYLGLLAVGLFLMRGPTILLGFVLLVPYQLLLTTGRLTGRGIEEVTIRFVAASLFGGLLLVAALYVGTAFFAARVEQVTSGADPSFFYRVTGPFLVAKEIITQSPFAGAGLTGEEAIEKTALSIYANSPYFSTAWGIHRLSEVLTNYFWSHWIYLGLFWGITMMVALGALLRTFDVPSVLFCLITWAVMGHASGAYVSPKAWFVMYVAAAASAMLARQPLRRPAAPGRAVRVRQGLHPTTYSGAGAR